MEQFLHETIREAGKVALSYFNKPHTVTTKSHRFDILTEADLKTNQFITQKISSEYPDHAIKSEEEDFVSGSSEYEWLVDPIDGTWNFAHQYPVWGTMICLLKNNKTVMSAVYFPVTEQLFHANEDGAYLNGKKIQIPSVAVTVDTAIGKVGASSNVKKETYQKYKDIYQKIVGLSNSQVRTSGAACELMFMLTGHIHYAVSNGGADHDHLPTNFILEKAGAIVSNSEGKEYERGNEEYVIAATSTLHTELLELFNE